MAAPKRTRKKATTDLGRSILQKERQRLAREQAILGEQFAKEMQDRMRRVERERTVRTPEHAAIERGMVRRVAAVLASEKVNVPVLTQAVSASRGFSAWTDFEQINVTYRVHEDPRMTAAILRGMLYHEGGHCRFTIPWVKLVEMAKAEYLADGNAGDLPKHPAGDRAMHGAWNSLEDQRMETAVVSDSPRKAVYFTPMIMGELLTDANGAAANWPLLVWRRYLPKHIRTRARALWLVQNGSNHLLANAIEETVDRYVSAETALDMYNAVLQMTEHLAKAPLAFKGDFNHQRQDSKQYKQRGQDHSDKLSIPIDPGMFEEGEYDDGFEDDDDEEVEWTDEDRQQYWLILASILCGYEVIEVEYTVPQPGLPGEQGDDGSGSGQQAEQEGAADEGEEEEEGEQGNSQGQGQDDDEDDDEAPSEDASDRGSKDAPSTGGSTGSHDLGEYDSEADDEEVDTDAFQQELDEAREQAETERYEDKALDGDVEAYETAKWDSDSKLLPYIPGVEDNGELIAVADNLAYEIEQTFQASTIDKAPAWVEQQRRGVVNVLRYETRQAGETEFFRAWVDDDQPGYDIAVSVLLDYSGSMDDNMEDLAQAGFACKRACDRLAIPCTVTLWDTEARTLFDAHEVVETMPKISAKGGTDPGEAVADLDNQRCDKDQHVVLIFTDGEWDEEWTRKTKSLNPYKDTGRFFIGFALASGYGSETMANRMIGYGCDEAYAITDLMEIPRRLEVALIERS